jgi:hypothetical protein
MPLATIRSVVPVVVIALFASIGVAHADAIDGDWCMGADHMNIDGSTIVTPGKNKITGNYGRYRYTYVVPANERGAGGEVKMVMIRGRETVHVDRPSGDPAKPEVWTRCKPVS